MLGFFMRSAKPILCVSDRDVLRIVHSTKRADEILENDLRFAKRDVQHDHVFICNDCVIFVANTRRDVFHTIRKEYHGNIAGNVMILFCDRQTQKNIENEVFCAYAS